MAAALRPCVAPLLGLLLSLPLSLALVGNPIQLPSGTFGLSQVDNSHKNSGSEGSLDGLGPTGYIGYQAIAPHKGLHLASAAASIRSINATAAMALENSIGEDGQVKFEGQELFTQTLGTYLTYHGGKVINAPHTMNVYLIFYGAWSKRQRSILKSFVASLDGPASGGLKNYPTVAGWWLINNKFYHNGRRQPITPRVRLAGIINDKGSMLPAGTQANNPLTHKHIQAIVSRAVNPKRNGTRLPRDPAGAYAVLTDKNVYTADFCQGLCAFHTSATFFREKLAYAFIGNPEVQCPLYCTYRYFDPMYMPPNKDLGADAVVDKLGHELAEIATNTLHGPGDLAGWSVGNSNVENADLCEWEYGKVTFEQDSTVWNLRGYNDMRFLLQMNFDRIRRKCVLQHNSP